MTNLHQFNDYSIRLLNKNDSTDLFELIERNRKRLEDFFSGTCARTKTYEDTKTYLEEVELKIENKTYFPFVVISDNTNSLIGFFDVKNIEWKIPKAELGYFMDEAHAGKGIATKAFSFVVSHCINEFKMKKLLIRTHESNIASR